MWFKIDKEEYGKRRTWSIGKIKFPWPFPIARWLGSSSAVVFGYPVYGANAPRYINFFFRIFYKLQRMKYWYMYRFTKRHSYHIVRTGLKPGYYDVDTLMLHACMTLLCRYVEDEMGGEAKVAEYVKEMEPAGSEGHGPRESVDLHVNANSEALAVYTWWKYTKPANEAQESSLMDLLYGKGYVEWKPVEGTDLMEMIDTTPESLVERRKELWELQDKMRKQETEMFKRLVEIRECLWT